LIHREGAKYAKVKEERRKTLRALSGDGGSIKEIS